MAYINENMQITIDEVAASNDISRLQQSADALAHVKKTLEALLSEAETGKGETIEAIKAETYEQIQRINSLISKHEQAISLIRNTVAKYQRLDRMVRDMIAAANLGK